jgi:FAD/FMN-containing dehydrogenase
MVTPGDDTGAGQPRVRYPRTGSIPHGAANRGLMTISSAPPSQTATVERELRAAVSGTVLVTADASYDRARRVWNGAVDRRPAAIIRCANETDVATGVRVARDHNLPLSVRGGGYDWAGRALREGGLVLDLSALRGINVDDAAGTAHIQGGVRAGDFVSAAHRHGVMPVVGMVSGVGMTGLTLGGGYGLLLGRHGLASDNLIGARMVLADGSCVSASPDQNPDLLWALRGGGGNFGVATRLRYRVHPGTTVVAGLLIFPLSQAFDVLQGYQYLISRVHDALTVMAGFITGPEGVPVLFLLPVWGGDPAQGEEVVVRLAKLGTPASGALAPMAYRDVIGLFDPNIIEGRHNEMRTRWLSELTADTVSLLVSAASRVTSPFSRILLHHFPGAPARIPVADTAFALRQDHLLVEIAASWVPGKEIKADSAHRRWADEISADLAEYALPGGYPSLLGTDERDRAFLGYGPNSSRLLDIKRRFDPDGVFSAVPALGES